MKKFTAGTGYSLNYSYDDLNRLNSVTTKKTSGAELFTRNNTYWDYEGENNRTTSRLKTYVTTDANGNLINGNRYRYDENGNITKIEEAYSTNAYRDLAIYDYDELNQLKLETRYTYTNATNTPTTTTVIHYNIDTAGNIHSVETTINNGTATISYTYGNSTWVDLLTAYDGHAIAYEGQTYNASAGSVTGTAVSGNPINWYNGTDYTDLTWTQGRRLSSITKHLTSGVRTYDYAYDMSGVRSSKTIEITVDGVLRNRRYDYITQNGKVVRETAYYTDGGEEFMHCLDFFYDENGNPFAMRKYTDETLSSYNTYYYILNAQGDVVKLIAPSGNVYAEYSYDAWGNILDSSGSLRNTNPLRYRGYYFDKETGFYYLQSRYYDPIVKRFLKADALVSTGQGFVGYNAFAYCNNNPLIKKDNDGHFGLLIAALIVIGVAATANDVYQICRDDGEGVSIERAEYEIEIKNSSKVVTPWMQLGYSIYANYFSPYKEEIKGSSAGVTFEWMSHNVAHYATSAAKVVSDSEKVKEINDRTKSTGVGKTIYSDVKSGHDKATPIMLTLYATFSPISALIDLFIEYKAE